MLLERQVQSGLVAGSIAATIGSVVQLPLQSPNDSFFNSGSVTAGALVFGAFAGLTWRAAANRSHAFVWFAGACLGAFVAVGTLAVVGQAYLDRVESFVIPLAAIVISVGGYLTPLLSKSLACSTRAVILLALGVAIAVGVALAGHGDAPSGHLQIPPRAQ